MANFKHRVLALSPLTLLASLLLFFGVAIALALTSSGSTAAQVTDLRTETAADSVIETAEADAPATTTTAAPSTTTTTTTPAADAGTLTAAIDAIVAADAATTTTEVEAAVLGTVTVPSETAAEVTTTTSTASTATTTAPPASTTPAAPAPTTTAAPTTTTTAPTTTATTAAPTTTTTVARPAQVQAAGAPISIPGGPVQMGFNVDLWGDDRDNFWNALEAVPGNGRLIAHEFKSFNKNIRTDVFQWHIDQGRDLLVTWNGTQASSILNGSNDDWIREHARELGSLTDTVMLRFWHEPDVSYKTDWWEGDPQNYIDSWHYVRAIFAEEGTDNIEWVWCPTAWNWDEQGALFYPGDAHVDWICADGYSGTRLDRPLEPIVDVFAEFQAWANQHPDKPILIAEFGAGQRGPGERADWVESIADWVEGSPNIRAVVYFEFDKRAEQPWDWRLRTEPDAWAAMLDLLSSAPFGQ